MRFLLASLLLVALSATAGNVYRSVDEDGNVQYSDRPEGDNVEVVFVRTQRPSAAPRPSPNTRSQSVQPAAPEQDEPQGPSPEEIAAERAENCSIAQDRLERYITSRRLYRVQADGERAYLSDQELDEARAKAQADVEEWCD